ncbi:MAG TPA: DNA gyrase inhibitor YacG [Steroidobacteraceae bacterium]|nr:DNA gyrase inhibitor YacG [Steroidobacteraceae bacterium]
MRAAASRCPTCGRPIQWSDAYPFRPFCSERCKLIDLGGWFSEQRGIPGDKPPPDSEEPPTGT